VVLLHSFGLELIYPILKPSDFVADPRAKALLLMAGHGKKGGKKGKGKRGGMNPPDSVPYGRAVF